MKKRALLSTFASLALAGVMCVGLAACGGGVDAKSVKGEEVTKEVWDAALNCESMEKFFEVYGNFKLEEEMVVKTEVKTEEKSASSTTKVTTTYTYAEKKTHLELKTKVSASGDLTDEEKEAIKKAEMEVEFYIDESGDNTVFYAELDGEWTKVESDDNDYSSATEELMNLVQGMLDTTDYDKWTYSADDKGYVMKDAKEGMTMVLKFTDGKLKAVYVEASREQTGMKMTYTYNYVMTYGGQSVTLPEVTA